LSNLKAGYSSTNRSNFLAQTVLGAPLDRQMDEAQRQMQAASERGGYGSACLGNGAVLRRTSSPKVKSATGAMRMAVPFPASHC